MTVPGAAIPSLAEPAGADTYRRATARARRANIISCLSRELDPHSPTSAVTRFLGLLDGPSRPMVVSADIDGLVSAAMLARVSGWRAVALVVKSETVLVHPSVADSLDLTACFGVDVFSSYMPNVSNHVALWGDKKPGSSAPALDAARAHDAEIVARSQNVLFANASLWAGIQGSYADAGSNPLSAGYRYPLGSAQLLLALLEVVDRSPRLFDREYLPWLVANCDGGLKTVREYAYNVPMWWSCLAAAVGPASLSEQIYQLATTQRPTEFLDVANRLRAEGGPSGGVARHLTDDWNLRGTSPTDLTAVLSWITDISGWPDPILGGVAGLSNWVAKTPLRGALPISGLPAPDGRVDGLEVFRRHLRNSLDAVHTNFAFFDLKQQLNWVSPWPGSVPPILPMPAALQPGGAAPTLLA